jgi:hypothetical protein
MGVAASGATLEIQLVADVARLRRDMSAMQQTVKAATVGAGRSFDDLARGSAASAAVQAAAAQKVARAAMTGAGGVRAMGAASGLARTQLLEMSHVVTSLSGSLLAGQNPLRAIALELPRIGQAAAFGGNGIRGLISSLLQMTGIIKVTRDAELEAAAATAAAGAAAVRRNAESAASALVAKEAQVALAQTQLEAVAGTELETAAMARLVTAQRAVADQSAKLAGVQQTLATVNTEAAATAAAAAAASVTGLGAVGTAIAVILPLAVLAGLAFLGIKQSVDAIDPSAQKLIGTLGLTDEQIKKLKDTSVTWGDVFGATLDVMLQKAGISSKGIKEFFASAFHSIGEFGKFSIAVILAAFGAMVKGAADLVMNLPAVVGGGIAAAANLGIAALEKLVNLGIVALNKLAGVINSVLGTHFGQVAQISLGRNPRRCAGYRRAAARTLRLFKEQCSAPSWSAPRGMPRRRPGSRWTERPEQPQHRGASPSLGRLQAISARSPSSTIKSVAAGRCKDVRAARRVGFPGGRRDGCGHGRVRLQRRIEFAKGPDLARGPAKGGRRRNRARRSRGQVAEHRGLRST